VSLDILTPNGQVSLKDEQIVADWVNGFDGRQYIQTPKKLPAKVDAILVKHNSIVGVVETKCRYNLSLLKFQTEFKNEWLVTWEKVKGGLQLAEGLCVPLFGFLYLVDDDTLLIREISEKILRTQVTATQRTINGGIAIRENAFIEMNDAKIFRGIKPRPPHDGSRGFFNQRLT
jgi:hypothetical protein